ncbi:ABC transporter ATP-binding protein [Fretibacterium sp. OH1220_COT-178]|uniref:ABC transporter ATP-binding protein n=1 Tax=Fretibacterium sp. OH1220_COT-178 TaxID=2491047 RepID=UPI000F5F3A26|nr:ABC transporter ATP-binding protein [Fretibacterium sp. OH1220_COT-178]RRD63421.1 ABC transporter ATP-binding protein [Fretibacterium sp. OH1220_COT-178]
MQRALLELESVDMRFGGVHAVRDMSFVIMERSLTGIIGPNGAGKTTLFNMISGVYNPTSGSIWFREQDITPLAAYQVNRLGIARTFQNLRLFGRSSVLENVMTATQNRFRYSFRENLRGHLFPGYRPDADYRYSFMEALFHVGRWGKVEKRARAKSMEFLDRVGLADRAHQAAGTLPYGLQRRLEIARALALDPKLLLLDEPAAGMNPEEVFALNDLITGIHRELRLTTLVIEHHMDLIMKICPHIICMNFGAKIAEGSPEEIQNNPEVLGAYLGEGDVDDEEAI